MALAIAVLFMLVTSSLEITSIHFLDQLQRREQATLVAQETLNNLTAGAENFQLPKPTASNVVRDGVNYNIAVNVTSPPQNGTVEVHNSTVALADLEKRAGLVNVTVEWTDERSALKLKLSRTMVLTRLSSEDPKQ